MGFFSHICPKCQTNIRFDGVDGELAVLRHIRHGELLGQASGEYDGYGGIRGSNYRNTDSIDVNSNEEICKSEYKLEDSGTKSGTSAYHMCCFNELAEEEKNMNVISSYDPEQGFGKVRAKHRL